MTTSASKSENRPTGISIGKCTKSRNFISYTNYLNSYIPDMVYGFFHIYFSQEAQNKRKMAKN
jgi:hypothetical protein